MCRTPPRLYADPRARFALMCLVWGLTLIPISIGVAEVPPMLFAGSRFLVAGALLMAWCRFTGQARGDRKGRVAAVAFFTVTATYAPMFWGMQFVPSGLAGVLNFSLTPVTLLLLSIAVGEDAWSLRLCATIALGVAGLAVLFQPDSLSGVDEVLGAIGIVIGTVAYCIGAVLARPLLRTHSPAWVLGTTSFFGAAALLVLSLLIEAQPDPLQISTAVWISWWFLLLGPTLLGSMIFFQLVRDWGAARAGSYAFISPVIAVLVGLAFGERVTAMQAGGMLCLLTATILAVGNARTNVREGT